MHSTTQYGLKVPIFAGFSEAMIILVIQGSLKIRLICIYVYLFSVIFISVTIENIEMGYFFEKIRFKLVR